MPRLRFSKKAPLAGSGVPVMQKCGAFVVELQAGDEPDPQAF
jgi:hypothetical protein